jgi:hypothetical protein
MSACHEQIGRCSTWLTREHLKTDTALGIPKRQGTVAPLKNKFTHCSPMTFGTWVYMCLCVYIYILWRVLLGNTPRDWIHARNNSYECYFALLGSVRQTTRDRIHTAQPWGEAESSPRSNDDVTRAERQRFRGNAGKHGDVTQPICLTAVKRTGQQVTVLLARLRVYKRNWRTLRS